jgi:hypothetical protein
MALGCSGPWFLSIMERKSRASGESIQIEQDTSAARISPNPCSLRQALKPPGWPLLACLPSDGRELRIDRRVELARRLLERVRDEVQRHLVA